MVYKTEYSTRRVYSSGSPTPNVSTSYSYSASPIFRRRKPLVTTRVIRIPSSMPLSDQEVLNFITVGSGRAGSVPRVAMQRLSGSVPPVRSNIRLNDLYSELEDEVARDSQGLGALVQYRSSRSVTPIRALTPGPIKRITYHSPSVERELPALQAFPEPQSYARSRADDVLLHLALGIPSPLYSLHHIPLRSALDVKEACDVRRQFVHERNLYDPLSRIQSDIYRMAFNRAPRRLPEGYIAGNGTLACLTYAGGRPIPKRRRFYPDDVITVIKAADDVNKFNNYYKPSAVGSYYSTAGKKPVYQPVFRSRKTLLGCPDTPASYKKGAVESKWETRSSGKKSPSPPPVRQPPRRIISTTPSSPPPEPRKPAADNISVTLPKPRKSVSDDDVFIPPPSPTTQNLDVPEAVVVRIPRKSISQEPPEKPAEPVEEVVEVVKLKRPSIKPEPEPEPVQEAPVPEASTEEAPAELEATPAEEPAGEPESTPASEPATEAPASAEAAAPEPESAPAESTAEAAAEPEPAAPAATESSTSEPEPAPTTESSVAVPEPAEAEPSVAEPEAAAIAESSVAEPEPEATESSTAEPAATESSTAEPEEVAESSVAEPEPAAPAEASEPEQAAETSEAAAVEPEPAAETSAAESAPAGDSAAEAAAEVSEAATADDDASAAPATEEISAAAEEPSNQAEPAKDEEEAVTNVEDASLVEPSVEKEETDRQIASPVEGYDDDEPAEPEELPFDPEESQSEAQRPGVSEDDRTLDED